MRKLILATLATAMLGLAGIAQPAEAACWWNGYSWVCNHPAGAWWWRRGHARWCYWHPYRCW